MGSSGSTTYSVGLYGDNGYRYYLPDSSRCSSTLKEFNGDQKTMNCVAISQSDRFAITCSGNGYDCRGPKRFLDKMSELYKSSNIKNIKHISFGPGDTWAITMKSGWCYYYCYYYPSGPLESIKEHNGSISYVSMSHKKEQWIVGWGRNGWKSRGLNNVHKNLSGFLNGVNSSNKEINLVEIGDNSFFVDHETGYYYAISPGANSFIENCSYNIKSVSLY